MCGIRNPEGKRTNSISPKISYERRQKANDGGCVSNEKPAGHSKRGRVMKPVIDDQIISSFSRDPTDAELRIDIFVMFSHWLPVSHITSEDRDIGGNH